MTLVPHACVAGEGHHHTASRAPQELSWLSGLDEESQARPQRPVLGYASEAALLALHRPAAVCVWRSVRSPSSSTHPPLRAEPPGCTGSCLLWRRW